MQEVHLSYTTASLRSSSDERGFASASVVKTGGDTRSHCNSKPRRPCLYASYCFASGQAQVAALPRHKSLLVTIAGKSAVSLGSKISCAGAEAESHVRQGEEIFMEQMLCFAILASTATGPWHSRWWDSKLPLQAYLRKAEQ